MSAAQTVVRCRTPRKRRPRTSRLPNRADRPNLSPAKRSSPRFGTTRAWIFALLRARVYWHGGPAHSASGDSIRAIYLPDTNTASSPAAHRDRAGAGADQKYGE